MSDKFHLIEQIENEASNEMRWRDGIESSELAASAGYGEARCGILGCGRIFPESEIRLYQLGGIKDIACCPECWKAMGLPSEQKTIKG